MFTAQVLQLWSGIYQSLLAYFRENTNLRKGFKWCHLKILEYWVLLSNPPFKELDRNQNYHFNILQYNETSLDLNFYFYTVSTNMNTRRKLH